MHALEVNEHMVISEFDHLQQTVDIFKSIHDVIRNEGLFVRKKSGNTETGISDPNSFVIENTTHQDEYEESSIFEIDDHHFSKLIAQRVG